MRQDFQIRAFHRGLLLHFAQNLETLLHLLAPRHPVSFFLTRFVSFDHFEVVCVSTLLHQLIDELSQAQCDQVRYFFKLLQNFELIGHL